MKAFFALFAVAGAGVGVFAAWAGFIVALAVFHAWELRLLWGWFAVPLFGLPALTYAHAIGIRAIVASFQGSTQIKNEYLDSLSSRIVNHVASNLLVLGIAWIVKAWWM